MARTQLQYGSQGDEVRELQNLLTQKGFYSANVDGIFGDKTLAAVKNYQKSVGLGQDGIVGVKTWGALDGGNTASTPVSAPTLGANPMNPTYDNSSYDDSTKGKESLGAYQDALDKVNNYEDFKYGNQAQLDEIMNSILNREKFSFDLNGNALYQQYKDNALRDGKLAMGDAIGQASAMTGGFGNSYAQSVGQQAFQNELQKVNDIIPDLWQMALDQHNMEGQDLYNQYGMLTDDYDRAYGEHQDGYNKLIDMLGISRSDYYDGADMFYTEQSNKNDVASKEFGDAMDILNRNDSNAWKEAEWNRDQTWRDEDIKRLEGDSSGGGYPVHTNDNTSDTTPTGGISASDIKKMQAVVGVGQDGKWGPKSTAAAGGLSAEEAYKAWQNGTLKKSVAPPKESAQDYADWDYGDWEGYFATIRNTEGKSAAEAELSRMNKAGYIPKEFIVAASVGARGSLGH